MVGLPKTIDNDVVPIRQTLGAWTAAEQGALYAENVVNEQSANPRMLVVHEVMGRNCGWLTAATARAYRTRLDRLDFVPDFGLDRAHKDIDAVYLPEMSFDLDAEAARLRARLDAKDCVTIFLSEGAGLDAIVAEIEGRGEVLARDPFGHVKIDTVNVGKWFADRFAPRIGAEKTLCRRAAISAARRRRTPTTCG